jgi:hypothetical protein
MKDFQLGVTAGYNSIKPGVVAPKLGMPSIPTNASAYTIGYKLGVEAARR